MCGQHLFLQRKVWYDKTNFPRYVYKTMTSVWKENDKKRKAVDNMRISYEEMKKEFERILQKKGLSRERAQVSAKMFADTSLDGVYSHGYQRFPRVVEYIEKGYIDVNALPEKITGIGATERWDGHLGMGNLNARLAMDRAVELSESFGIGLVAMSNTNHWMRGGTYGWQAADAGCIGICWTNTMPNMPAWGGTDSRIGNNPFVLAVPGRNGEHVVVDTAMAQYSYGKLSVCTQNGTALPYPGGYDEEGKLTCDPAAIEKTRRVLPIGYWKGSGLSIVLDLIGGVLTLGKTVTKVGRECEAEYGLTQIFIAIKPELLNEDPEKAQNIMEETLKDIKASQPERQGGSVRYPGESTLLRRKENLEKGIPVNEEIWEKIKNM